MKVKTLLILISTIFSMTLFTSTSFAGFYIHPKAGIIIDMDGEVSSHYGVKGGYQLFKLVAVEVGYMRISRSDDNNFVDLSAIGWIPLIPIIKPYVTLGTTLYPLEGNIKGGAGLSFSPPGLSLLHIGAGANYFYIPDGIDFMEAYLSAGINF